MSRFRRGQVVRVTDYEHPDFKIEGAVIDVSDAGYIRIGGHGWVGQSRVIEVIKEAPTPFYQNVDRAPVVGDIYLWSPASDTGRPTVNTINYEGLEDFLSPRRRVLIYDGIANTTVHGARW